MSPKECIALRLYEMAGRGEKLPDRVEVLASRAAKDRELARKLGVEDCLQPEGAPNAEAPAGQPTTAVEESRTGPVVTASMDAEAGAPTSVSDSGTSAGGTASATAVSDGGGEVGGKDNNGGEDSAANLNIQNVNTITAVEDKEAAVRRGLDVIASCVANKLKKKGASKVEVKTAVREVLMTIKAGGDAKKVASKYGVEECL